MAESSADALPGGAPLPIRSNILSDVLQTGTAHGTKFMPSALSLSSSLIRAFVEEAVHRAAAEADDSGDGEITEEHLEKVLPQLLLDFGP